MENLCKAIKKEAETDIEKALRISGILGRKEAVCDVTEYSLDFELIKGVLQALNDGYSRTDMLEHYAERKYLMAYIHGTCLYSKMCTNINMKILEKALRRITDSDSYSTDEEIDSLIKEYTDISIGDENIGLNITFYDILSRCFQITRGRGKTCQLTARTITDIGDILEAQITYGSEEEHRSLAVRILMEMLRLSCDNYSFKDRDKNVPVIFNELRDICVSSKEQSLDFTVGNEMKVRFSVKISSRAVFVYEYRFMKTLAHERIAFIGRQDMQSGFNRRNTIACSRVYDKALLNMDCASEEIPEYGSITTIKKLKDYTRSCADVYMHLEPTAAVIDNERFIKEMFSSKKQNSREKMIDSLFDTIDKFDSIKYEKSNGNYVLYRKAADYDSYIPVMFLDGKSLDCCVINTDTAVTSKIQGDILGLRGIQEACVYITEQILMACTDMCYFDYDETVDKTEGVYPALYRKLIRISTTTPIKKIMAFYNILTSSDKLIGIKMEKI